MIIVTGAAGFIGSAVLAKLNEAGISDIIAVDQLAESEKWWNLQNKKYKDYLHKNDFINLVEANALPWPVDAVIHMGACSSTTETDGDYLLENNTRYTRILAQWCINKEIRFIYASSAATYGDGKQGFSDDDSATTLLLPINRYGYSKQLFDIQALDHGWHQKIAGLKFFNVYGPNEYHKGDMASVIFKAFHQINETGKLKLFKSYKDEYDDGGQKRDFIYVKDVTRIILWLLEHKNINGIFNLGTGDARTWNDLANATFKAMGKPAKIEYIEMPENLKKSYQYFTEADMSKLKQAGAPVDDFHSLEDGIADYVQNYLQQDYSFM